MAVLINVYATVRTLDPIDFEHAVRGQRDRTDPELGEHLQGFVGFVTRGDQREMTQALYHVARHIQRVRHHLSLEVEKKDLAAMEPWARRVNAILLWPDGSVRDPAGAVLVDAHSGAGEAGGSIPYPADALARKKAVEHKLGELQIPVSSSLPPVEGAGEVVPRSAREVAARALALFVVAARAGSIAQSSRAKRAGGSMDEGQPMSVDEFRQRVPRAFDALSPREQAFLAHDDPSKQEIIEHAWRYEGLQVLLWALGRWDDLPMPTSTCDVSKIASMLIRADRDRFVTEARLRSSEEILDALDLHLRLHWAAREARQQGLPMPADLDPGVLQERHLALNWLIRFENAPWDEVDTPT